MSRRRVTALSFAAAVIVGAAAGLLFGLLWATDRGATPISVTHSVTPDWPAAYRCGVIVQPEDLDRADRCACEVCE
jgi:hypothetical protein